MRQNISIPRLTKKKISQLKLLAVRFESALGSKDYGSGCRLAEQALSIIPGELSILSDYAYCLMRFGRFEEAYKVYKSIYSLPEKSQARASDTWIDGLVEVCGWLGRTDEVQHFGRMALEREAALYSRGSCWEISAPPPDFDTSEPQRNIISYSLYGADPKYCEGAVMNAKLVPELYPGWTCRVYLDSSVPQHVQQRLRSYGAQIIDMDNDQGRSITPTMWRFLVMDDLDVHRYLLRDADSLLSEKESSAVSEWVVSARWFHHMRDYFTHTALILAGMWGGCRGGLPAMEPLMREYVKRHDGKSRYMDQHFLREILWPTISQSLLSHDEVFGFHNAKPFPSHAPVRWGNSGFHVGCNASMNYLAGKSLVPDAVVQRVKFVSAQEEFEYAAPVVNGEWQLNVPVFMENEFSTGKLKITLV